MHGHRHVRRRIVALFLLGIALPSGLLGYLALRGVRNDQALFEREVREELEGTAREALATHRASLDALGDRLSAALAPATRDGSAPPIDALESFAAREPLVDAVFGIAVDGGIDPFVVPARLYEPGSRPFPIGGSRGSGSAGAALADARRAELRDGDLDTALATYEGVLAATSDESSRAEAMNGIARIRRREGDLAASTEAYRRLVRDFAGVRSSAGIPFGIVGRLELMQVYERAGDFEAGTREAAELLRALLKAEHDLSAAQYAFVADRGRAAAARFLEGVAADDRSHPDAGSLAVLLEAESTARARQQRVERFRAVAFRNPGVARRLVGADTEPEMRREIVRVDGDPHYILVVLDRRARTTDASSPDEWGILLDPTELRGSMAAAVERVAEPAGLGWALRDETGGLVEGMVPRTQGLASVALTVPDRFPGLGLEVFAPPTGAVESFFTSPRSVYLYAFVLVLGLLAFGLTFTVRTLTHQLALSRMQSDFVSTVSHEFKSPVTAIRQLAEMLQADRVPSEDRRRRYYDVLVEQSERLTALMDHILDFAKMDAGYELERREMDPGPHLEDVANRVQQRVRHQGYTVRQEIEEDLPAVSLDPDAIALAVTNLIDNGIKYSGAAREVILRAAARNGDLEIAVQDFGVGLDPADRDHVFERFYRGGSPLTRGVKGTGLGLTLVKQIVDAHGGSIGVDSRPGEGSTFTIRLPTGAT